MPVPSSLAWGSKQEQGQRITVSLVTQSCPTLCDPTDCRLPGSSVHGDSPGKNTGMGCHALLQGIFATQGLNPGLPHCRRVLYYLRHQGSPPSHLRFNKYFSAIYVLKIKQGTKNDGIGPKGADSIEEEMDMTHPLRSTLGVASSRKPS